MSEITLRDYQQEAVESIRLSFFCCIIDNLQQKVQYMPNQVFHIGERYKTKYGVEFEIIGYNTSRDITIKFPCGYIRSVQGVSIHRGAIDYPLHRTCMGIGYIGFGRHNPTEGNKRTRPYTTWYNMFNRCIDTSKPRNQTYTNVNVDERWHNYQVFADWFEENYVEGFELDKDLIVRWSNVYSPETCSFVPPDINVLMTDHRANRGGCCIGVSKRGNKFAARCFDGEGTRTWLGTYETEELAFCAYKDYKESIMRKVAIKYREKLHPKVFDNLMTWDVVPYPEHYRNG